MSVITCPSGLSLEIRGLKGKELKLLQDKAAKKTGRTYDNVLTACTLSVVTSGPAYDFVGEGAPEWDKVLVGDKFYALLAIRAETFGEDYDFKFQCNTCEERVPWYVKLPDGLPIKKLAQADAEAFKAGAPLEAVLPGGKVAKYRLAVGADERASAMSKETDAILTMLARRIVSIDDVNDPRAYLEEASLNETKEIVKAFEAHDCGIETDIEVQCQKCSAIQEVRLPLERNFWMPVK